MVHKLIVSLSNIELKYSTIFASLAHGHVSCFTLSQKTALYPLGRPESQGLLFFVFAFVNWAVKLENELISGTLAREKRARMAKKRPWRPRG